MHFLSLPLQQVIPKLTKFNKPNSLLNNSIIYNIACFNPLKIGIFREIINLKRRVSREGKIPYFIVINWYFFFVGLFYFYGGFLASSLGEEQLQTSEILHFIVKFHKFISFCLWIAGFLGFVLSLR